MQSILDQVLTGAVDLWCVPNNPPPATANLIGYWRGRDCLLEYAQVHGAGGSVPGEIHQPNCVVIVEYARHALADNGNAAAIKLLEQQCQRVLTQPCCQTSEWQTVESLVHALTCCVLAAIRYRNSQDDEACKYLAQAGAAYDRAWQLSTQRIGGQATPNPTAGENLQIGDPALRLLDFAYYRGAFGKTGITQPTWLTLRAVLSRIFGHNEPPLKCENVLKSLVVRGDQRGSVLHWSIQKLAWPDANPYAFLDPLSFGISTVDPKMTSSLRLAIRCCRQSAEWGTGSAIRLILGNPGQAYQLQGASAGALLACGLIATLEEQPLQASKTTTARIKIKPEALKNTPALKQEATPIRAEDLQIAPITGVVTKINEAWLVQHGIDEFFVHPTNASQWQAAHPHCHQPKVTAVDSLAALREGLWGDRELEGEIERHAQAVNELWELASQTLPTRPRAADAPSMTQSRDQLVESIERDHRFECYVPPSLRVEGPLRLSWRAGDVLAEETTADPKTDRDGGDAPWSRHRVAGVADASRDREEAPVPGDDDEPLLKLLELALRGRRWDDAPGWLKPNGHLAIYDVAGIGKTVCSYRLAHLLTDSKYFQRLYGWSTPPLVVRLDGRWRRALDGRLLSLPELLQTLFCEEAKRDAVDDAALVQRTVNYALKNGRVILILDGFDQFKPEERAHAINICQDDHHGRQCKWIVTSRVHALDEWRDGNRFFQDHSWTRVRIDLFSATQQTAYFSKGQPAIGERWRAVLADPQSMAELLGLPMVLWMIRVLIEAADERRQALPVFSTLSQLYLVTSRKLLARALEKNEDAVKASLQENSIAIPKFTNATEQLEFLEHVLSLFAFEMLLIGEFNGRLEGTDLVQRFEKLCRNRYLRPIKERFDAADEFDRDDVKDERKQAIQRWNWALEVLRTIELSHRSVTEAYGQSQLVFRSRKMLECHAARYLTRYANRWDIFATEDAEDRPPADRELLSSDLERLCAWNFTTDPEWKDTWRLAIEMPLEPISCIDSDGTVTGAVLDHAVTCQSLSCLFRQPKAYPGREARPTELIYLAWHLFEWDDQLLSERQFLINGKMVRGEALGQVQRKKLGEQCLLGEWIKSSNVIQARKRVLEEFRDERSQALVQEFKSRLDTILVDSQANRREAISANDETRQQQLAGWAKQTAYEKSHTFLQCPPVDWLRAFETSELRSDPQINPAIAGHDKHVFTPMLMQATTVTRWQYRQFDPAFENWKKVAKDIIERASAVGPHAQNDDFPIICTSWFDAWVFCKWLGEGYHLPNDWQWEHAARAGTTTEYHFGDACNGSQANCDGRYPYGDGPGGQKSDPPRFLERTTPVGCMDYPGSRWGLWDVHGNVLEWCCNGYGLGQNSRLVRGGSYAGWAEDCRIDIRNWYNPRENRKGVGFRISSDVC